MTIARIATGALAALLIALGAPGAAQAKPKPPSELTVGDRARPLNVHGPPQFGWMVGDGRQSAYQLQVTRGGEPVWDSGRVASSEQSYVAYGGRALEPGTSYEWTVRTW